MVTLAANVKRNHEINQDRLLNDIPVIAADIIFEGSAVGEDASTGFARPLVNGDVFLGFAIAKVDNTLGAAGDKNVRVSEKGRIQLDVVGVVGVADLGDGVNATDDDTFLLGAGTAVGKIVRFVTGTTCIVAYESLQQRSI